MVSKASDAAAKFRRSHGEQPSDVVGTLSHKMHQIKKQIQAERIVSVKEKVEKNAKKLEDHVLKILSTASSSFTEENGSARMFARRIEHPLCKLSGLAQGYGDKDHVNFHEVSSPSSSKLPHTEKLPPYTTWIFLDRNQRMADDQSVVGRRRIYYDQHGSEALICSDSEEEIPETEEEKHEFSPGEDKLLSMVFQEYGQNEEVTKSVSHFIGASTLEIQDRYNTVKEKNQEKNDTKGSGEFGSDNGVWLSKGLSAALDSFDNLFCRRCMMFDCRLHGCSQPLVFPTEKQLYWSEHDEDRKPCSDHCYLRLITGKNLPEDPNADSVHKMKTRSSERESTPASPNAEEHTAHDVPAMKIDHENLAKRKAMKQTDTEPHDLVMVSDDFNASCKKQKRLAALDAESGSTNEIQVQDCNFSAKSSHLDVGLHKKIELQIPTNNSGSASYDESGDIVRDEQEDDMEVLELKQFSESTGQIERVSSSSEWKLMEKELYMKGLEIFGRNSCLIARNLLSGLKSCMEVSTYMHEGGVSMPHGSVVGPSSFTEDNGKTDTDHTDQEMPTKSRLIRRRGKARKLKYSWKSAGHPSIWKRIADGKNQSCKQYTPCGCQSMCGKQCSCLHNGTCCEKYCGCSKSCKNRFRGCHCAKSQCRSRQCPCFAAGRECDPDVCRNCWVSCGDGTLEEPPRQGDGQCGNMRLLLRQQQRILLAKSDVAGWGAFLKNSVNKNDYLGEYTGELISHREADKRGKIYDRANSSFLFDLNDQYVLDAYRKGDKLKFANHSSNPNCYAKVMLVAGDHRVGIFAKEHIEASEELFYDYRYGPDQAPAWARKPEGCKRDDSSVSQGRAKKHQSH
ncbi:histone-lysine N-methyltransferase EZA1 isoform X3 [Ziziphus jujuba]|uniref:Histone-lysine N-methyltransferase EZA1 isoform X3 n=1 Tax=Ziziphus jujuba TaxID=326968 RepID=A0A6P4A7M4_ZIZJJ|nr:histone-lysine N-methyltransferase EZA1 isoform X3 [Ziziphus jujuba]